MALGICWIVERDGGKRVDNNAGHVFNEKLYKPTEDFMRKSLLNTIAFLVALSSAGLAVGAESSQSGKDPATVSPVEIKGKNIRAAGSQAILSITVVKTDIRANGYTVEIRNASSVKAGRLEVQTSKCKNDNVTCDAAGGVAVLGLDAGASTKVVIDQPVGWNTGYTKFFVKVWTDINGHNGVVGQRSYGIPQF